MDRRDFRIGVRRQKSEQLMLALNRIGFGAALAMPGCPDASEEGQRSVIIQGELYCGPVLRHPAEFMLPAVDLGGRVWLVASPVKAGLRPRLLERAIDAGARDLPHAGDARHAITASQGERECLAHRLDLLWAKGRLPSSAAILA